MKQSSVTENEFYIPVIPAQVTQKYYATSYFRA
jgi:hypothetical protein